MPLKVETRYALLSYAAILSLIIVYYSTAEETHFIRYLQYTIPLLLMLTPMLFKRRLQFRITAGDAWRSAAISCFILGPIFFLFILIAGKPAAPPPSLIIYHLFLASIPEEAYFRGYLQGVIGNNLRGIIMVSLLFTMMHSPRYLYEGEASALLTIFPSIVLGWLYMKKRNLLYPVVFHLLSNLLFISFF